MNKKRTAPRQVAEYQCRYILSKRSKLWGIKPGIFRNLHETDIVICEICELNNHYNILDWQIDIGFRFDEFWQIPG